MQLNNEQVLDSHTAGAEGDLGDGNKTMSNGKFKDTESLQKAYNSLEAEFTKRCQKLKQLEGELEQLKSAKTSDLFNTNPLKDGSDGNLEKVQGENNDVASDVAEAAVDINAQAEEKSVDKPAEGENFAEDIKPQDIGDLKEPPLENEAYKAGDAINAMADFLESYPDALERMDEFMVTLADHLPTTKGEFERAYIAYLNSALKKGEQNLGDEEYLYNLMNNSGVKERIIKEYLQSLNTQKPTSVILGGAGQIPTIPPMRPKNISEAALLARNIIKLR